MGQAFLDFHSTSNCSALLEKAVIEPRSYKTNGSDDLAKLGDKCTELRARIDEKANVLRRLNEQMQAEFRLLHQQYDDAVLRFLRKAVTDRQARMSE
jgi:hypothetical protein